MGISLKMQYYNIYILLSTSFRITICIYTIGLGHEITTFPLKWGQVLSLVRSKLYLHGGAQYILYVLIYILYVYIYILIYNYKIKYIYIICMLQTLVDLVIHYLILVEWYTPCESHSSASTTAKADVIWTNCTNQRRNQIFLEIWSTNHILNHTPTWESPHQMEEIWSDHWIESYLYKVLSYTPIYISVAKSGLW